MKRLFTKEDKIILLDFIILLIWLINVCIYLEEKIKIESVQINSGDSTLVFKENIFMSERCLFVENFTWTQCLSSGITEEFPGNDMSVRLRLLTTINCR